MADQKDQENKNNNTVEYESLINNQEQKPPQNRERMIMIFTIAAIIILGIVILFSVLFFNQKYNLLINYEIIETEDVKEPYNQIKVQLVGENTYEATFPLGEKIELKSIEEGSYQLNISAIDNSGNAYYYYSEPELFVNEDKTLDNVKLSKTPLEYKVSYRWENNDLYITLPSEYDQYLIYRKNNSGIYEPFETYTQNVIILSSIPVEGIDLKFALVKEKKVYDFSDSYYFQKNTPPSKPVILSPIQNQEVTENKIYFVWQVEDPDGDSLLFDLYLVDESAQEQLIAENIQTYFYEYNNLTMDKNYTLRIVAKDQKGGSSYSEINFSTGPLSQEKVYLYSPSGQMGVTIYEVTDPSNPKEISTIETTGNVTDVIKHDNYLYILNYQKSLDIAEISNLSSPRIVRNLDLLGINGIKIANGYLYVRFENGEVDVYSIKNNPSNPEFLGKTEIKFYGALEPEIRYIETESPVELKVEIIKGAYPVRINLNNRVIVSEFSLTVANSQMKEQVENSFSRVFDTFRLILSTYKVEDFTKNGINEEIEGKLVTALNELFGTNTSNGVKSVNVEILRVE